MLAAAGAGYVLVGVCIAYPIAAPSAGWPTGIVTAAVGAGSILVVLVVGVLGMVRANRARRALSAEAATPGLVRRARGARGPGAARRRR